jgi:hypothetical protein
MWRHIAPKTIQMGKFLAISFLKKENFFLPKKRVSVAFSQIFTPKKKTDGQISSVKNRPLTQSSHYTMCQVTGVWVSYNPYPLFLG